MRHLIFDWSGTLVDDLPPTLDATNHVIGLYGLPPFDREGFRTNFRLPYPDFYNDLLPGKPLAELENHFRAAFAASTHRVVPLEASHSFLQWCMESGISCFVLTSMDTQCFETQLDELDMRKYFRACYSGVLDKRAIIGEILHTHSLPTSRTAYIGDMEHDVETAHHGGVTAVAVLTGYTHRPKLEKAKPHHLLDDLHALRNLLEKINRS